MFRKPLTVALFTVFLLVAFASCSDYQKLLKSSDYDLVYTKALEYYEDQEYIKASALFLELLPVFRGTERAEDLNYRYAYCYYHQNDYIMAEYYFRNFITSFPNSDKAEECAFMVAYCYYMDSPIPSLDQSNTYKAIEELQVFLNTYRLSERTLECNRLIDELRDKLVVKSYASAKLYYELGEYKASITALNNSLKEFPNTKYREEILFLILRSAYELARNSVVDKIQERYEATVESFLRLKDEYPETKHFKDAERIHASAKKALNI